jgi:alkylated DNA repair dioxygenase AlkB
VRSLLLNTRRQKTATDPAGIACGRPINNGKMELFENTETGPTNLLPFDGTVIYYGKVMDSAKAKHYMNALMDTIAWKNDEAVIFGKHIITKRKVAWYADHNYSYTYSNTTRHALPWTAEMLKLKALVEGLTGTVFNSCLLNLYHTGEEGMAWHSDDEKALGKDSTIASLSFGAERKFSLKHRISKETRSLMLEPGSLLVMQGTTQTHWLHSLPKSTRVKTPRVNLTFRTMVG